MQIRRFTLWTASLIAVAMLWGCGSSGSGGSDVAPEPVLEDVQTLGMDNCAQCHAPINDAWLAGGHGNSNTRPGGPHDPVTSSCGPCHNQLAQATLIPSIFPGEEARDVVACESCHGAGSAHRGLGPLPTPRPDWEQCVQCHDHPEGVRHADDLGMLASNVGASAHNNADDLHASTTRCQRCHTVEGSIQLAAYTGDADVMHLMDELEPIDLEENLHPVTCSACHEPHTDELRSDNAIVLDYTLNEDTAEEVEYEENWDPNGNGVPDQFDFCTSCHTYYNQDGTLIGSGSEASGTAEFYHNTSWYRTLPSTHYDNPATSVSAGGDKTIEGYVIRQNGDSPCFDCHGHELRTNTRRSREVAEEGDNAADYGSTIHTQWASSAHAGGLLQAKYAAADANPVTARRGEEGYEEQGMAQVDAVMAAGAIDASLGNAWAHYDWDTMAGGRSGTGRQECQHCHTASGAVNFLDSATDGVVYDSAANDFSHLEGWSLTATETGQNEVLYCWGCHTNAQTGLLRATGEDDEHNIVAVPIPLDYPVDSVETTLTAPDVDSGVCLSCHSGRGNVNTLLKVDDADTDFITENPAAATGFKTGGTSTHYMTAGAILNQVETRIGYTFGLPAEDYADPSYYAHNALGCAECHMTSAESHSFAVVAKDETGVINQVVSPKCVECHDGAHGAALVVEDGELGTAAAAAAFMEAEAEGYHEALEILAADLEAAGTPPQAGYPYFSGTPANEGHSGAMHNYSLLHHEPGAYAHNRLYAKRLIFDSIDWLDNNILDGAITVDAATYPEAAHWFGADESGVATRP